MTQPGYDNPFQSPTVLEQRPASATRRHPAESVKDELPFGVAVTWMLFIFSATVHAMAGLYFGQPTWCVSAILSTFAGFMVLYPSLLSWGLGLGYAFVMAGLCFSVITTTQIQPRPGFFEGVPLAMYLGILALMFTTSRYYLFRSRNEKPAEELVEDDG